MATRSLGTLTLDLVAKIGGFEQGMSKAEKSSAKWRKQVKRDAQVVGQAVAAGAAVAGAALVALTVDTVRSAEEIQRFAAVSNSTTQEFQRYAAGAKAVGIEQDKLADIFKDTTDRVGDFLQTGGGPMLDFFENIAPQVGVTAEQFRGLSGPQALGLFVDSLEKANTSQEEMTFYMEAIASDATMLLPLLRNNAEGFREFGQAAADAGAILDQDTLSAANELNAAFFLASQSAQGMQNDIAAGLLPVLSDFASILADVSEDGTAATVVGEALGSALKGIAAAGTGVVAAFDLVGRSIGGTLAVAAAIPDGLDAVSRQIDIVKQDISGTAEEYSEFINRILDAGEGAGEPAVNDRVKNLARLLEDAREQQRKLAEERARNHQDVKRQQEEEAAAAKAVADAEKELEKARQEAANEAMEIQQNYQNLLKDLQTDEERLTEQVRERLSVLDAVQDITDAQRQEALGRIADAATMDAPELGGVGNFEGIDAARTELQDWYSEQLDMLRQFRAERADLNATWDEEELALKAEYENRLTEITQANEDLRRQQQLDGFQAILDVAGKYYEGLEGEEAAYTRAAIQLGSTLLDERKREALTSILASTNSAAMGAYEALSFIPVVGPALGVTAAAGIYAAGGIAAANIAGLAHDGIDSIPQDGTWLLEKGERVTTAETSAKLDRTLGRIEMQMESGRGGSMGGAVEQNIYVQGKPDRRTATQIARDTERRQRMTAQRLGVGR